MKCKTKVVVDARKLRQSPEELYIDGEPCGLLIYPGSDCGCIVGVTLVAAGVPREAIEGEATVGIENDVPDAFRQMFKGRASAINVAMARYDDGDHSEAAALVVDAFAAVGIQVVFEGMPDVIEVYDPAEDRL